MELFDTENYASSFTKKLIRSFQLGPKYYIYDIPKYYYYRAKKQLAVFDFLALYNPFREIIRKEYHNFEKPKYFDEALKECYDAGITFSMPYIRLKSLSSIWEKTSHLEGDVIEFGAYKGATSLFLATLGKLNNIDQKVLLLDTFEGIPSSSKYDLNRKGGEYIPAKEQTEIIFNFAKKLGIEDRIIIKKGLFSKSIEKLINESYRYSFAHIDANIYTGTLEACEYVIPRMIKTGGIVFDDYNGLCDLGARLAIDSYLKNNDKPMPLCSASAYLFI
jgi:hypothetical protein